MKRFILALVFFASPAFAQDYASELMGLGLSDQLAGKIANDFKPKGVTINTTGFTIAIDSSTSASRCKGTGTFNGTTAVTVATTCAATSMHVAVTPTSDPTGSTAAYCWVTNIVNGTSFDVDCDQANDGTFSWVIIKEG